MDPVRIAVIGAGFMGRAHARVIKRISEEHPGMVELSYIVDRDRERAVFASRKYGGRPLTSPDEIPMGSVDFAIIAVPTSLHWEVFQQLVNRDVHGFLVEKPITHSIASSMELAREAMENGIWVSVGHIERFNPAVREFHKRLSKRSLGDVLTYLARRVGPYTPRVADVDVVYDLGVHETDNALAVFRELPERIRAYTIKGLVSGLTDHSLGILSYSGKGFASIEVNRITPFKLRIMYLTTTTGVVFLDYMRQELKIYKGIDEVSVRIRNEEPLYLEDYEVLKRFMDKSDPPVDVYQAITSVYLCDKILESTRLNREIVLEESRDYSDLRDVLEKGLNGYRRYMESLSA
jgi:UDP-N-acetylglucosamine 3-dehydrogenase